MTRRDLDKLLADSAARVRAMPEGERAEMFRSQRESWVRGEIDLTDWDGFSEHVYRLILLLKAEGSLQPFAPWHLVAYEEAWRQGLVRLDGGRITLTHQGLKAAKRLGAAEGGKEEKG